MVSTQFKKSELPLDLPQTGESPQETEQDTASVLAVTADAMELDGTPVTMETLPSALAALQSADGELSLSLECDRRVPFEQVVQVLTVLQSAGISRIGIVHDPLD